MTRKNKRQKRQKKRTAKRKRQQSRNISQPAILRKDPLLRNSLSHRHRLVECRINRDWREDGIASVHVLREAPSGLVLGNFLIDIVGRGLKDVWGDHSLGRSELDELFEELEQQGLDMVSCDYAKAHQLIHGSVLWAKKCRHRLPKDAKIWLRLMEPADSDEIDLTIFGVEGKPLSPDDGRSEFEPHILSDPLALDADEVSAEILDRIGDIKAALVDFSTRPEYHKEIEQQIFEQFGPDKIPDDPARMSDFIDRFVLEHQLEKGQTVAMHFVEQHRQQMSADVRKLVVGWQKVIEGFFEVLDREGRRFDLRNLINERSYRVYKTIPEALDDVRVGDFMNARIIPAGPFYVFSAFAAVHRWDGSERQRAEKYRLAVDLQMQFPRMAFRDNDEKLNKSREISQQQHEEFVALFGSDEIVAPGLVLQDKYHQLIDHWNRVRAKKDAGNLPTPPNIDLPTSFKNDPAAGMISDPIEGVCFLEDYGGFLDLFSRPQQHLGRPDAIVLFFGYLEDAVISDIPFRRVQERSPEAFEQVLEYYQDEFDAPVENVDDLMRIYKPDSFDKLPGTVVVLDSEITRIAAQAKPKGVVDRIKGVFSKNGT